MFKSEYKIEKYVCSNSIRFYDRRALAQLRCGSAPIAVETGRYKNGVYLPVHLRICPLCSLSVEDEYHVLMQCNIYSDFREELFEQVLHIDPSFINLCDQERFIYLMSNCQVAKLTAKTCRCILQRRRLLMTV